MSQEGPGGARRGQEEPGGARRKQTVKAVSHWFLYKGLAKDPLGFPRSVRSLLGVPQDPIGPPRSS